MTAAGGAGRIPVMVGSSQSNREADQENSPTYCAFLPNNEQNFPNVHFEETTTRSPVPREPFQQDDFDEDRKYSKILNFCKFFAKKSLFRCKLI